MSFDKKQISQNALRKMAYSGNNKKQNDFINTMVKTASCVNRKFNPFTPSNYFYNPVINLHNRVDGFFGSVHGAKMDNDRNIGPKSIFVPYV